MSGKRTQGVTACILVLALLASRAAATGPEPAVAPRPAQGQQPAPFHAYHGSLHNHTSYSDGTLTPGDAFTAGQSRGLDFMAVTDHSHAITDAEWEDTLSQANSHTANGSFVALRGAEYTQNVEGHTNVYGTARYPARSCTSGAATYCDASPTLSGYYGWMAAHPESVGQFNHPSRIGFNDWTYWPDADPAMQVVEVGNGNYSGYAWSEEEYLRALDSGWHVAPTNNGDTHSDKWGIDNPGRTGIWAAELTPMGVMEALRAMRTFATEDGNLEIYLAAGGAGMGETISTTCGLAVEVYVDDPDAENLASLQLLSNGGQVVTSTVPAATNPYTWTVSLPASPVGRYFFARAQQADGNRAVTAPIWVAGDEGAIPGKCSSYLPIILKESP